MITWVPLVGSHLSSCYHFKPKKLALLGVTLEIQGYEALTLGTSLKCTQLVPAPIPPCTRDEPLLTVGLLTPVWTGPPPFAELQARVCGLAVVRNPHQAMSEGVVYPTADSCRYQVFHSQYLSPCSLYLFLHSPFLAFGC